MPVGISTSKKKKVQIASNKTQSKSWVLKVNHPLFIYRILLQNVKCFIENQPPASNILTQGSDEGRQGPQTDIISSLETFMLNICLL